MRGGQKRLVRPRRSTDSHVVPMVYSFVCHAFSSILLSLSLSLNRVGVHLLD